MYSARKTDFGITVRLTGFIEQEEARTWYQEMVKQVEGIRRDFCVFVDMRGSNRRRRAFSNNLPPSKESIVRKACSDLSSFLIM